MRRLLLLVCAMLLMVVIAAGWGLHNARALPVVRRATIALPAWPEGAPPVRAVLLSDIHIGNVAMDRGRLRRIVTQVAALRPDLVLIAGDHVSGFAPRLVPERARMLEAELGRLRPPLGTIAVLGNHDIASGPAAITAALHRAGITVLQNDVARRGPLAIGGVGDDYSGKAQPTSVLHALAALPGAHIVLTHSPDVAPRIKGVALVLAGHTHCGQIVLPLLGGPSVSRYGERYRCGLVHEGGRTTIVSAGLGASNVVPLRFGAPPDICLLRLGPG